MENSTQRDCVVCEWKIVHTMIMLYVNGKSTQCDCVLCEWKKYTVCCVVCE